MVQVLRRACRPHCRTHAQHVEMSAPGLKIVDGLFLGGEPAAQDLEAVRENKVTHIINCCGKQVPSCWSSLGIRYLTYNWVDAASQIILDPADKVANEVFNFIEEAVELAEGVLIHSFHGQSRSCCVLSSYMMTKYRWSLRKTTEFLKCRHVELKMKPAFLQQLVGFEFRLAAKAERPLSLDWDSQDVSDLDSGELLLRNTYTNCTAKVPLVLTPTPPRTHRLKWSDDMTDDRSRLEQPASPSRVPLDTSALKPALKGAQRTGGPGASAGPGSGTIAIRTRSGIVHCTPDEIVHKRFGLKFECSTIILEYVVPAQGLRVHHPVKVDLRNHAVGAGACDAATAEELRRAHAPWLAGVSTQQLVELVGRLRGATEAGPDS